MAAGRSEMVSNDCTMDGESTIRCTMPVDRHYNRLSPLLWLATLQPTIPSALLCLASLQLTIRSTIPVLPVDITTCNRYPLFSV
jgi:hypothetical protein